MSYDVWIVRELDGVEHMVAECGNYTSNVSPMWTLALGTCNSLGTTIDLHPVTDDLLPHLQRAITAMTDDPSPFVDLNPENGWGDYDGALRYLQRIAHDCRLHPGARVVVSR